MPTPHIPAWLGDAASVPLSTFEAEAVALVGAHARGAGGPADAYQLLVVVDDEHIERLGWPLATRWEALDAFPGPVAYLRATMAEVMAAIYCGHPEWALILDEITPLHDPLGIIARISSRLEVQAPVPGSARLEQAQKLADEAGTALATSAGLSATAVARAHLLLLDHVRLTNHLGDASDAAVAGYLDGNAPEAHLVLDQVVLSGSVESRIVALRRLIAALSDQ